jgi:ketosteroid isomerase-like protein
MEPRKAVSNLVRKYFSAYESKDRKLIEELLSDDFTFTSPVDNHIDRATYFQKCWPFSEEVRAFHIVKLFEEGNEAFVAYQCEPKSKAKFRNTEFFRVQGNRIKEVQVYFGSLPEAAAEK